MEGKRDRAKKREPYRGERERKRTKRVRKVAL
jgi:hypothetical protein